MTNTADSEIARLRAQLEQRNHCIESFQNTITKLNEKIFNLMMANQELECTLRAKEEELAQHARAVAASACAAAEKDACIDAYQHAGAKANEKVFSLMMANQELECALCAKDKELSEQATRLAAVTSRLSERDACIEAYQHASAKANEKVFNLMMANQELTNTLCTKEEEVAAQVSKLACANARLSAKDACIEAYQHATLSLNTKLWNAHMTAQELETAVERASAPTVSAGASDASPAGTPTASTPSSVATALDEARQAYFGAYVMLVKTNLFAAGVTFTATQQEVIDKAMQEGVSVSEFPKWTSRFFQTQ